ncbi:hypothetical protein ACLBPK_29255, partial [Klebsiella pneumoniae]
RSTMRNSGGECSPGSSLQRVARQIEARMEEEEVWYEMP